MTRNSASRRRILILVPFKVRDLEGLGLLAYLLETRYGHEVRLGSVYGVEEQLMTFAPDLLVMDHLMWSHKAGQARLAKRFGMKLVVLPTEGLFQETENAVRRAGKLQDVSHQVDAYLSWGHYVANAILAENLLPASRVFRVGCPRFDFYAEPLLSLIQPKEEFLARWGITNPSAPTLLWATSTTYTGHDPEKIRRRYTNVAGVPARDIEVLLEDERTQYREHSAAVVELARRNPEWNVLIKTHPAESIEPYLELAAQAPNLHIAFNAPIREFLCHCDVLLQRGCTTATEAWMLGKPVLELTMGRFHNAARPEYLAGNHVVRTVEEAEAAVRGYLAGGSIPPSQQQARDDFIADFYFRVDGKASERCAEIIHGQVSSPAHSDEDQARVVAAAAVAHQEWRKVEDSRLPNRLKDALGIPRGTSLRWWKQLRRRRDPNRGLFVAQPDVTPAMVRELFDRFETVRVAAGE